MFRLYGILLIIFFISGCSTSKVEAPINHVIGSPEHLTYLYKKRLWNTNSLFEPSSTETAAQLETPIQKSLVTVYGPSIDDAISSLATKIWLIENAKYSIDASYYIFANDLVGYAMLGAMCKAIERGVDVRLMVDAIGSFSVSHKDLKGLLACKDKKNTNKHKASAQVVIINALSKPFTRINRRSHDKLLIIDGNFPKYSRVMTGGRNISLDYYGINKDGNINQDTFKDLEVLLSPASEVSSNDENLGYFAEQYFTQLFRHDGNKKLQSWLPRTFEKRRAQKALEKLKNMELFAQSYQKVSTRLAAKNIDADVKLAHELHNLTANFVVSQRLEIIEDKPSSIVKLLDELIMKNKNVKHIKVISPYAFLAKYNSPGELNFYDGREEIKKWLDEDKERTIEVISNSVLTSDNFMAQSIIDIDSVPRALLPPELIKLWQKEESKKLAENSDWLKSIQHPRLKIYQLGKVDSHILGGDKHYGKLHAKAIFADNVGFVGTTNLDYRSRLYNNEVGYFYHSEELSNNLLTMFEALKTQSYLWGSKEWLEMRQALIKQWSIKGNTTSIQRKIYDDLDFTGLKWLM